jgi:hypothetical protein
MLLKTTGQALSTAKRVKESYWEMPRGYWKKNNLWAILKGIGKPLGNVTNLTSANRREGSGNFHPFSLKHCISFYTHKQSKTH